MDFTKKYKSSENISFLTTFLIGFVIHLFGLVNVLHNHDNITIQPSGSGIGVLSGRWLISIFENLFGEMGLTYNLPYVNGLLFLFLIAVTVKYIVRILDIKNTLSAILIGAIFVAFPSVTSTLFYRYTSVLYGVAILCAVLAVWYVHRFRYGWILSVLLIACSLGIYQAYVPFTIGLMIILLLKKSLAEESNIKDIVKQGVQYVGTLVLGLLVYFAVLKICLAIYDVQLISYNGIDQIGTMGLAELPRLLKRTVSGFVSIVLKDYYGLSQMAFVRIAILVLGCICAVLISYVLKIRKKKWDSVLLTALLCALFPIAINFIVFICPNGGIYTLMVYSFALIFTVPFVLLEMLEPLQLPEGFLSNCREYAKKTVSVVTLAIVLCYGYLANLNYTQLYFTSQKVENYMSALVTQVRMTEGFDPGMDWAFIGDDFQDPMLYDEWEGVLRFGGSLASSESMLNAYSRRYWIRSYYGYYVSEVSEIQLAELEQNPVVREMPCFPRNGSVRIIDNVVVIKLENVK